jgi:hypothetical protein
VTETGLLEKWSVMVERGEDVCLNNLLKISVVLVRKRTIPTKRPQAADEVSANFR